MKVDTFLLTRFNLGLCNRDYYDYDVYMAERIRLFNQTTVPSVSGQSDKGFKWIVLVDKETPKYWIDKIQNDSCIVSLASHPRDSADIVKQHCRHGAGHVITARIDNDDAVHSSYISEIKKNLPRRHRRAVTFPSGIYLIKDANGSLSLFESKYRLNMFPAVVEDKESVKSVYACSHTSIDKSFILRCCPNRRMWLWNFHGSNLSRHTVRSHAKNRVNCHGDKLKLTRGQIINYIKQRFGATYE